MDKITFKQDKGTAGLTILLSLIVMLFVIGLLVMIFTIMGGQLETSTYDTTTASVVNETLTTVTETGENLAYYNLRDVTCSITYCANVTNNAIIPAGNYSHANCNVKFNATGGGSVGATYYNNSNWKCTYSYTYEADNSATDTMNDTVSSIAGATSWFDIFIVIGSMVVLILLTVVIITAIRSSGMVGGETQGANSVGTA